jgi:hypothetical protein
MLFVRVQEWDWPEAPARIPIVPGDLRDSLPRRPLRMTIPMQLVLQAPLRDPQRELYDIEIGTAAGLPSGTVHPILARLEGAGRQTRSLW